METIWILITLFATSPNTVQSSIPQRFSTQTACNQAAQSLAQGAVQEGQKRIYDCVPFDPKK